MNWEIQFLYFVPTLLYDRLFIWLLTLRYVIFQLTYSDTFMRILFLKGVYYEICSLFIDYWRYRSIHMVLVFLIKKNSLLSAVLSLLLYAITINHFDKRRSILKVPHQKVTLYCTHKLYSFHHFSMFSFNIIRTVI